MTPRLLVPLLALCAPFTQAHAEPLRSIDTAHRCEVGVFGASLETFAVIIETDRGFEYSFHDGEIGLVSSPTSRVKCQDYSVLVDDKHHWPLIPIRQTSTVFHAGEINLAGKLLEPIDAGENTPLLIYAHGSERTGWINRFRDPYQMVARGISVFVYDKRGTGKSQGQYTQNFPKLADDLVAASNEAKRLAAGRFGRFGLAGLSQGGWIAPLAARGADADFVAIGFGLVVDIREEDASQVQKELSDKGFGDDILAKAREVTDVTARIAASDYTDGIDELAEFQSKHSNDDWFRAISGGYTGVFLNIPAEDLRRNGVPAFKGLNIDWSLSPIEVLRGVKVPQLWILAGEDREAPIDRTIERLTMLREGGSDIDIRVFPKTDHGMREYIEAPDGTRDYGGVTSGYYDLFADWVDDGSSAQYGTSYSLEGN